MIKLMKINKVPLIASFLVGSIVLGLSFLPINILVLLVRLVGLFCIVAPYGILVYMIIEEKLDKKKKKNLN